MSSRDCYLLSCQSADGFSMKKYLFMASKASTISKMNLYCVFLKVQIEGIFVWRVNKVVKRAVKNERKKKRKEQL